VNRNGIDRITTDFVLVLLFVVVFKVIQIAIAIGNYFALLAAMHDLRAK
jgi:hypothetical protein